MNIGIDFGSTYSTFSTLDRNAYNTKLRTLTMAEGDPSSIPSVVSIIKGSKNLNKATCGLGAKNQVGKSLYRCFEAFKMLITENREEILLSNGYDNEFTPRLVAKTYIESCLKGILGRSDNKNETIDEAVICIPEVWGNSRNSIDGRNILLEILANELNVPIKHARVVTEPEAASAFFAYNYEKVTQNLFNGHLLLIDYGGGTLDLTLTEIHSEGNGRMEIAYRESGGAGENHISENGINVIGNAGIAYMRAVAALAIIESGIIADESEIDYAGSHFMGMVRDLESQMKTAERIKEIEDCFGEFGKYDKFKEILDEDEEEFVFLEYKENAVPVTFQQLYKAYRDTIEGVLNSQLMSINAKVAEHIGIDPCMPEAGKNNDFKIALVGGFSACYFVKEQIYSIYNIDPYESNDTRVKNISADQKELAISYGAALLADGCIQLQRTARFSIGMHCKQPFDTFNYGIRYHQVIEVNHPYFICADESKEDTPTNRINYSSVRGNIDSFVMEFSDNFKHGGIMPLKREMLVKLDAIPDTGIWNCGFSMDENEIVSFHVVPSACFPSNNKPIVIKLDKYGNLFEMGIPQEVSK